jgi:hypothetical protein
MDVERTIGLTFTTGCGDVTAQAIVASILAGVEGRLTEEKVRGRVDDYDVRISRPTLGKCVNVDCSRFEYVVPAEEGDGCVECRHALRHESGLTWADARTAGYVTAGAEVAR